MMAFMLANGKAPEEVEKAAALHWKNFLRKEKASVQHAAWEKEMADADRAFHASKNDLRGALKEWDPSGARSERREEMEIPESVVKR